MANKQTQRARGRKFIIKIAPLPFNSPSALADERLQAIAV